MNCSFPVLLTTTCDTRHIYWTCIWIASVFNYYSDYKTDLDIRARERKLINSVNYVLLTT